MTNKEQMAMYKLPQKAEHAYEEQFKRSTEEGFKAIDNLQVVLIVNYSESNLQKNKHPIKPGKKNWNAEGQK